MTSQGVHLNAKAKARVLKTARQLGYLANSAAQTLVTGGVAKASGSFFLAFDKEQLLND